MLSFANDYSFRRYFVFKTNSHVYYFHPKTLHFQHNPSKNSHSQPRLKWPAKFRFSIKLPIAATINSEEVYLQRKEKRTSPLKGPPSPTWPWMIVVDLSPART